MSAGLVTRPDCSNSTLLSSAQCRTDITTTYNCPLTSSGDCNFSTVFFEEFSAGIERVKDIVVDSDELLMMKMKTHRVTLSGTSATLSALSCDTSHSYYSDSTCPDSEHNVSVSSLPGHGDDGDQSTPSPDPGLSHQTQYRSVSQIICNFVLQLMLCEYFQQCKFVFCQSSISVFPSTLDDSGSRWGFMFIIPVTVNWRRVSSSWHTNSVLILLLMFQCFSLVSFYVGWWQFECTCCCHDPT